MADTLASPGPAHAPAAQEAPVSRGPALSRTRAPCRVSPRAPRGRAGPLHVARGRLGPNHVAHPPSSSVVLRTPRGAGAGRRLRVAEAVASTSSSAAVGEDGVVVSFPQTPLFVPYPSGDPPEVVLSKHGSAAELATALADYIAEASREAIAARGLFVIALSGGSLLDSLAVLKSEPYVSKVDWSKWNILWVDERYVRHSSDDSNFKQAAKHFLAAVEVPEEQILPTDDELPTLEEVADDYDLLLRDLVEDGMLETTKGNVFPRLDLVLLGVGPEGHTASLFPNSPALSNVTRWVLPIHWAPKPPHKRVTMTLPVINSARKVAFVAAGEGKAEVVQRIFERPALPGSLPAQLVRPYGGSLTWFFDESAAARLSPATWNDKKHFPSVQIS